MGAGAARATSGMSRTVGEIPGRAAAGAGRCRPWAGWLRGLGLGLGLALTAPAQEAPEAPGGPGGPGGPGERLYSIDEVLFTGGGAARLPVNIINGRLVVTCDVSTAARRLPANLFIDFESPSTLELHNQAAAGLRAERQDGSTIPITVHLPGLEFQIERRQIGDDPYLDRFTKWYSIDLGEVAVIGTLGGEVWRNFNVTFDLPAGELVVEPLRAEGDVRSTKGLPAGTEVFEADLTGGFVWLRSQLVGADAQRWGVFALGSGAYDSTLDWNLAAEWGAPAGNVGEVRLGGAEALDLAERLAFRPSEVPYAHPDGPLGVLGLNFLGDFRVEIDRANRKVFVSPIRPAEFPADDLAFFQATWDLWGHRDDPDALLAWIEAWCPAPPPADADVEAQKAYDELERPRLAEEASRALSETLIYGGGSEAELETALAWLDRSVPADLRATSALELMDLAASAANTGALLVAGRLGIASGRDDRYPDAVHKVHARMGRALLDAAAYDEAWRHLLSSAFGQPENGPVNLGLGEYYEHQARELAAEGRTDKAAGRYRRAFSRYLQAAIRPDSGPSGVEAMARVQVELDALDPEGKPFSAELVERLIAGRVRNFGAPGHFHRDPEVHDPDKVVLVEYFTNAYLGDETRGGAIAGGLAQEGLTQHFGDAAVAFLSYHLPEPRLDPLVHDVGLERAAELGIDQPLYQVVDGVGRIRSLGKWRDAEQLYTGTKDNIEKALSLAPTAKLAGEATLAGGRLEGRIEVTHKTLALGPLPDAPRPPQLKVVLAERRVIFPGSSGIVIHRMVARAELVDTAVKGRGGEFAFEVDLDAVAAANDATLERLVDEGAGAVRKLGLAIDPAEVVLVAWIEGADGAVGQAHVILPEVLEQP